MENRSRNISQDLRVYFMIGRKSNEEKIMVISAYQLEDALSKAHRDNPGFNVLYNGQNVIAKELFARLNIGQEFKEEPKKIGKEQFKNSLMLAADDFIKEEKDRVQLKRIIEKL